MNKARLKIILDYVPLIVLIIYAIILLITVSTTNIVLQREHYIGLIFLLLTTAIFLTRHKSGVLCLGLTIILGVFKVLSLSAKIEYWAIGGSVNDHTSGDIKFQATFILWLILHLIFSGRYYAGILTEKYWQDIFS